MGRDWALGTTGCISAFFSSDSAFQKPNFRSRETPRFFLLPLYTPQAKKEVFRQNSFLNTRRVPLRDSIVDRCKCVYTVDNILTVIKYRDRLDCTADPLAAAVHPVQNSCIIQEDSARIYVHSPDRSRKSVINYCPAQEKKHLRFTFFHAIIMRNKSNDRKQVAALRLPLPFRELSAGARRQGGTLRIHSESCAPKDAAVPYRKRVQ